MQRRIKVLKEALGAQCTYASFSKEKFKSEETGEWKMENCVKVKFNDRTSYTIIYQEPLDIKHIYTELMEARHSLKQVDNDERSADTI